LIKEKARLITPNI